MDRGKFYAALRRRDSGVFGTRLSQPQVDGVEALLNASARYGLADPHHVAHSLAEVYHETGGYMLPIKETVYGSHKDKNPSDATVIARLDRAFAKGQLSWVTTPYWRTGWFGRGQIQLTHEENYRRMGRRLGVDLVGNRALALAPNIGADIAVVGMAEGLFTSKKLSDYRFPADLDDPARDHPRRIVNGKDGTDAKIARYHRAFLAAIEAAGGVPTVDLSARPTPAPAPAPAPEPTPFPTVPTNPEEIGAMLKRLFKDPQALGAVSFVGAAIASLFGINLSVEQVQSVATGAVENWEQVTVAAGGVAWIVQRWRALRAA